MRLLRNADSFEPRDAVKGDIARMLFYIDPRDAGDDGVPGLALLDDDGNSGPLLGCLCTQAFAVSMCATDPSGYDGPRLIPPVLPAAGGDQVSSRRSCRRSRC